MGGGMVSFSSYTENDFNLSVRGISTAGSPVLSFTGQSDMLVFFVAAKY